MTKTNEMKHLYWVSEALKFKKEYEENKTDKLWKLVKGCGACVCEFDRKHKEEITQFIQDFIWEEAYLRNEISYERYLNSGYFKEKYLKIGT